MAMGERPRSAEGAPATGLHDKGLTKWVFRAGGRRGGSRSRVTSRVGPGARDVGWPKASFWARVHSCGDCESCGIPVPASFLPLRASKDVKFLLPASFFSLISDLQSAQPQV
jgi:hypothetical protein